VSEVVRVWRHRDVSIVLPAGAMRGMFDRARKWGLGERGRFDARAETVFLWSAPARGAGARPIGAFTVAWEKPTPEQATIELIAWDREVDGSLDQLCRGVELLAGALVAR
jgi:hypothetical protein